MLSGRRPDFRGNHWLIFSKVLYHFFNQVLKMFIGKMISQLWKGEGVFTQFSVHYDVYIWFCYIWLFDSVQRTYTFQSLPHEKHEHSLFPFQQMTFYAVWKYDICWETWLTEKGVQVLMYNNLKISWWQ